MRQGVEGKPVQQVLDDAALLPDELMKLRVDCADATWLRWVRCCGGCCRCRLR